MSNLQDVAGVSQKFRDAIYFAPDRVIMCESRRVVVDLVSRYASFAQILDICEEIDSAVCRLYESLEAESKIGISRETLAEFQCCVERAFYNACGSRGVPIDAECPHVQRTCATSANGGKGLTMDELIGITLTRVERYGDALIEFESARGAIWEMRHRRDCCETVEIADICGDLADLVGSPILQAEVSTNTDNPPKWADSFLWTFYKLATAKGYVTIRWLGESNGYYSEDVSFDRVSK